MRGKSTSFCASSKRQAKANELNNVKKDIDTTLPRFSHNERLCF